MATVSNSERKVSILVVDDNEDHLEYLRRTLSREGFKVIASDNGNEAVRIAEDVRPDVVLLDVCMPEIDGFHVAMLLKGMEETRDLPIIFISSAYKDVYTIMEAQSIGAYDFIVRPVNKDELLVRIRKCLGDSARESLEEHADDRKTKELSESGA
ncbi:MAG: response regulator [Planctomycetes bacterium]|nr:response regulator [Planctomycetota bacterium]